MAISSSMGYTNTTTSSHNYNGTDLQWQSNYQLDQEVKVDKGEVVYKNYTSPIGQQEYIGFKTREVDSVQLKYQPKNLYPARVKKGREITIQLEEYMKLTSSVDDSFRVFLPIVGKLQFFIPIDEHVDGAVLREIYSRIHGVIEDLADTTHYDRFDELIRGKFGREGEPIPSNSDSDAA